MEVRLRPAVEVGLALHTLGPLARGAVASVVVYCCVYAAAELTRNLPPAVIYALLLSVIVNCILYALALEFSQRSYAQARVRLRSAFVRRGQARHMLAAAPAA